MLFNNLMLSTLLIILLGCSNSYDPLTVPCSGDKKEEISIPESGLTGKWKYNGFYKFGSFNPTPDDAYGVKDIAYNIILTDTNTVFGNAENTIGGNFNIYDSGKIRFSGVTTGTRVNPRYPWWEDHMITALNNARCYELNRNKETLIMHSTQEKQEPIKMKFERMHN